jgi:hypothetical protein
MLAGVVTISEADGIAPLTQLGREVNVSAIPEDLRLDVDCQGSDTSTRCEMSRTLGSRPADVPCTWVHTDH